MEEDQNKELNPKKNKHKYSTYVLFGIIGLVVIVAFADAIDGFGTKGYLAKFLNGETIGNASIWDNGTTVNVETELTVNGSRVCTEGNGACLSGATVNGTIYDATRSFELLHFCNSASFSTNSDKDSLNCSLGEITDLSFKNGNWSCMSCVWDTTKCSTTTINNISNYGGLNMTSEHILASDYGKGFYVMCNTASYSSIFIYYCYSCRTILIYSILNNRTINI